MDITGLARNVCAVRGYILVYKGHGTEADIIANTNLVTDYTGMGRQPDVIANANTLFAIAALDTNGTILPNPEIAPNDRVATYDDPGRVANPEPLPHLGTEHDFNVITATDTLI
jgi:hypothetical protein